MRWLVAVLVCVIGCKGEQAEVDPPDSATDAPSASDSSAPADTAIADTIADTPAPAETGGGTLVEWVEDECGKHRGAKMVKLDGYCIDATEVTRAQYGAFSAAADRESGAPAFCTWNTLQLDPLTDGAHAELPQGNVNLCDAATYCAWAGKRLCGKIGGGMNPRGKLADASSSQWYRACSSNGAYKYPYGNEYDPLKCATNVKGVHPATAFPECRAPGAPYNAIVNMSGNVAEWELSCDAPAPTKDTQCLTRGAGNQEGARASCDDEWSGGAGVRYAGVGFRCCRDV